MKKRILPAAAAVLAVACAGFYLLFPPTPSAAPLYTETRIMMGTYVTVKVPESARPAAAVKAAFARMEEVYGKFSAHLEESPVYRFNNSGETVKDPEVIGLFRKSCEISALSKGAFDPALYSLMELWGFYSGDYRVPDAGELLEALELSGAGKLIIEEGAVRQPADGRLIKIDLGGIAKGYAVDEAAAVLRKEGISDALIDAGGDIYSMGSRGIRPWRIGIRDPFEGVAREILEVGDLAVATSGNYEKFFEKDGKIYHHILEPSTGLPARGAVSVTAAATSAATADAWSTALFVMGIPEALEAAEAIEGLEALMIDADGERCMTSGFADFVAEVCAGE